MSYNGSGQGVSWYLRLSVVQRVWRVRLVSAHQCLHTTLMWGSSVKTGLWCETLNSPILDGSGEAGKTLGNMRTAVAVQQPLDLLRCHAVSYYRTHAGDKGCEALRRGGVVILNT